jgi:hypothetical protein
MGDIVGAFSHVPESRVRSVINKLRKDKELTMEGDKRGATYSVA